MNVECKLIGTAFFLQNAIDLFTQSDCLLIFQDSEQESPISFDGLDAFAALCWKWIKVDSDSDLNSINERTNDKHCWIPNARILITIYLLVAFRVFMNRSHIRRRRRRIFFLLRFIHIFAAKNTNNYIDENYVEEWHAKENKEIAISHRICNDIAIHYDV